MARALRRLDTEGHVVEVSSRTLQGRYLMRPSAEVNELILGVLGRAQRLYPVEIFAFVFLSNHFHLLLRVLSALRMSQFSGYLKCNLSKELGRLHGWEEKFWGERYHSASVSDSEEKQESRFRYILLNGCKEGLVDSPLEWPGVSSAGALYRGERVLEGTWYDRTAQHRARVRGARRLYPRKEQVHLSTLPYLEGLTALQRQAYVVAAVREVEEQTRQQRLEEGRESLGARAILKQDPHGHPESFERSPARLFHASSYEELLEMKAARNAVTAAYREASARLRRGEANVRFPEGTFPPPQAFVQMRAPP